MSKSNTPKVRPKTEKRLGQLAAIYADAEELDLRRVRQRLSAMMFVGALERVREEDTSARFLIKGGLAIELRFQDRARTTRDLDAVFAGSIDDLLTDFDEAFAEPFSGFTFTYTQPEKIRDTGAHRLEVKLSYEGRSWSTLKVEVSPPEGGSHEAEGLPPFDLSAFNLDGPVEVSCQSLRYQTAQKIHACTEVFSDGRENDRVQDILDLQLVREITEDETMDRLNEACVETFRIRKKHDWPPRLTAPPSWRDTYRRMAEDAKYPIINIDEAVAVVQAFVDRIAAAG
jgi:hypothetical protein